MKLTDTVRKAIAEATPGLWRVCEFKDGDVSVWGQTQIMPTKVTFTNLSNIASIEYNTTGIYKNDAHLIANVPTWLAQLCDRVEELEKIQKRLYHSYTQMKTAYDTGEMPEDRGAWDGESGP